MSWTYEPDEHGLGSIHRLDADTDYRINVDDHDIRELRRVIAEYEDDNGEVN